MSRLSASPTISRRPADVVRGDAADLGDALGRVRRHRLLERLDPDGVRGDERAVDPVVLDQLLREPVQDRQVRSRPDREVHLAPARADCVSRGSITIERGGSGPLQPVELVHPEHRLRLGRVDPDVQDRVAVLDVVHARRLAVAAERLLQRLPRRRRAEARVAVEVVRADPAARDERERVVVLDEQLAARVEAERAAALRREQLARALDDEIHRLVPARLAQLAVAADERTQQPVGRVVRLPAVQALRAEPTVVHAVAAAAAHADDAAVANADLEPAAVRAEHARRLHPALDRPVHVLVDPHRPFAAPRVRRPRTPRIRDPLRQRSSYALRPATP